MIAVVGVDVDSPLPVDSPRTEREPHAALGNIGRRPEEGPCRPGLACSFQALEELPMGLSRELDARIENGTCAEEHCGESAVA